MGVQYIAGFVVGWYEDFRILSDIYKELLNLSKEDQTRNMVPQTGFHVTQSMLKTEQISQNGKEDGIMPKSYSIIYC